MKQAEKDIKAGRIRDYDEFLKELKKSGEIYASNGKQHHD
jgi:hypothetical protein